MSALTRYMEALRVPNVRRLLALGAVARLPPAIQFVALVLFVRELADSYAVAGAVTAAFTIGYGAGAPAQGRLADRYGAPRVLWPLAIMHAVAIGLLIAAGLADQSGAVLTLLGLASGLLVPPTGAVVRRVLAHIAADRRDLQPSIFALDGLSIEVVFMGGPALTALIIVVASPAAALLFACGVAIVAVAGFVSMPTMVPEAPEERSGRLGAFKSRGMRTLICCAAPFGVAYGAFQVSIIAFADDIDASSSAPWLFALLALGGALGVLAYGAVGHRFPSSKALAFMTCLCPVCFAPIILATSLVQMAPLVVLGGALITPIIASVNQIVGDVAPSDAVTEAYAWVLMVMFAGASLGLIVGGHLVDISSWHAGIALAIGSTLATAIVTVTRRRTLPDIGWEHVPAEAV